MFSNPCRGGVFQQPVRGQTLLVDHAYDSDALHDIRLRVQARDVSLARTRPEAISIRNLLVARIMVTAPKADTAFGEGQDVSALIKCVAFDRQALPRPEGRDAG